MRVWDRDSSTQQDFEHFLFTITTAIRVRSRAQFYLWAQGGLQYFLPHDVLVCCFGDVGTPQVCCEIFCGATLPQEAIDQLSLHEESLAVRLARRWQTAGHNPLTVDAAEDNATAKLMAHLGFVRAQCHGFNPAGLRGVPASGSLFILLQSKQQQPPTAPLAESTIEIMLPYMHMAWSTVVMDDRKEDISAVGNMSSLSPREQQVLQWVREGKTNHEIGHILAISPLTVKNHVQKILRKLGVANRAQAVVKGVQAGVL